jgi:hypothetical protein
MKPISIYALVAALMGTELPEPWLSASHVAPEANTLLGWYAAVVPWYRPDEPASSLRFEPPIMPALTAVTGVSQLTAMFSDNVSGR